MALINANFDEVPDVVQPIKPGIYDAIIESIVQDDVKDKDTGLAKPGKTKLVVELKIDTDGAPDNGRKITSHIGMEMKTTIKNLYHSATGNRPGAAGFDTADLVGKKVKIEIASNSYKDKNGKTRDGSQVEKFIIPA